MKPLTLSGEWSFTEPGITAIGHPAPLEVARNHGVYLLEEGEALRQKYMKGTQCYAIKCSIVQVAVCSVYMY